MAENAVRLDSIAGSFNTSVGTAVPGPNLGVGLQVATGVLVSATTLSAVATGTGSTVDLGCARANVTLVMTTSAGVSAGAVALELSQDNVNFFRRTAVTTATATTVFQDSAVGAWRYARGVVTTNITGGTVSASLMAS
jgi:hypothetical protein